MEANTDLIDKKQMIQARLRDLFPDNWRWSLLISRPSTIILTITLADVDFVGLRIDKKEPKNNVLEVQPNMLEYQYKDYELLFMTYIVHAMESAFSFNADRYGIEIRLGTVQTPFKVIR